MSRVINIDSSGKQRVQLTKAVAVALRELSRQSTFGAEARDLAAFVAAALGTIHDGIDASVGAWEKRGYWVKADRFRMEWAWTGSTAEKMRIAVIADDWAQIAALAVQTAQRLSTVQVSEHNRLGKPWVGAYERLKSAKTS